MKNLTMLHSEIKKTYAGEIWNVERKILRHGITCQYARVFFCQISMLASSTH